VNCRASILLASGAAAILALMVASGPGPAAQAALASKITVTTTATATRTATTTTKSTSLGSRTTSGAPAVRVTVTGARGVSAAAVGIVEREAAAVGAAVGVVHQGTVEVAYVSRSAKFVQQAPPKMGYPMTVVSIDPAVLGSTVAPSVVTVLRRDELAMSSTSATLRKAKVGDTVMLSGWQGQLVPVRIGAVLADALVNGNELAFSRTIAESIGFDRPSSVRVWGMANPSGFAARLDAALPARQALRVSVGALQAGSDSDTSQPKIKKLLGEFAVSRVQGTIFVRQDAAWSKANLVDANLPIIGHVRCHRIVVEAATAALNELVDTRRSGGCWTARELRTDFGTSGRTLSRHSWGAAIDINPSTNPFGGVAQIDRRVIDAFARHGFIWGGDFPIPDGMHFEYSGVISDAPLPVSDDGESATVEPGDAEPVGPTTTRVGPPEAPISVPTNVEDQTATTTPESTTTSSAVEGPTSSSGA
jgi:hypothetical protein